MLNISDVRVNLACGTDSEKLKAYCSITIDECFMVRGIKLIDGSKGMFIAMPSRKTQFACRACKHKNPISNNFCGKCGSKIGAPRGSGVVETTKMDRVDIAHPLNAECRQQILDELLDAFRTTVRVRQTEQNEALPSNRSA